MACLLLLLLAKVKRKLMMTEFNLIDPLNSAGLPGGSKKLQKGSPSGEMDLPMSFSCLIDSIPTQEPVEMSPASPSSVKGEEFAKSAHHDGLASEDVKTNRLFSGKINLLSLKQGQNQTNKKDKNLLGPGLKESRTGKNHPMTEVFPGLNKPGLHKPDIESGFQNQGVKGVILGKYGAFPEKKAPMVEDGNGKNSIGTFLKSSGLKGEQTIVEHEQTGVKEFFNQKIKNIQKEIPSSTYLTDQISSKGKNYHTDFHTAGRTALASETVNMESRALIHQITNGVDRPGSFKIELASPHPGTLDMDDIVRNNKVNVVIQTDNTAVRHMLYSNGEALKSALGTQGLIADNINLLPSLGGQKQTSQEVKNLLSPGLKKSRSEKTHSMRVMAKGLNNPGIESGSLKPGLSGEIAGKDEAFKVKSGAMVKDGNGKNSMETFLKVSDFKEEQTSVDHEIKNIQKEIPSSKHLADKIFSVGGYHHTVSDAAGRTAAVNESANNYRIEPRVLINQIAKGVNSSGRVKIALTPPHLGKLDMDVIVRNNKVHIILQAENNDVRHILQSNVDTLKSALRSQGLIADNIIVSIQERLDSDGDSGFRRNETLFKENNNQKENKEDQRGKRNFMDHAPLLSNEENLHAMIDGCISVFV
jgi:flagellar hook-length control protein FliK